MTRIWFRPPPVHNHITSFLFFLDLKVGATVITLFALFNKLAGVFGIIALFQGGSLSQITLYLYSLASIVVFLWALQGIADEDASRTLRYAHAFMADHMLSSSWTLFFALWWYAYTPHDGRPPQLAAHQAGLMDLIEDIEKQYVVPGQLKHHQPLSGQERIRAAQQVWRTESGFSAVVLLGAWLLKIYFALVIYAFAVHLRHGTYHTLPLSKGSSGVGNGSAHHHPNGGGYRALRNDSVDHTSAMTGRYGSSATSSTAAAAARFSLADEEEQMPAWSEGEESGSEADDGMDVDVVGGGGSTSKPGAGVRTGGSTGGGGGNSVANTNGAAKSTLTTTTTTSAGLGGGGEPSTTARPMSRRGSQQPSSATG